MNNREKYITEVYMQKMAEREKFHYDRAIKCTIDTIPPENKIMLYSDVYEYNEGYFSEIEELIDYCKEKNIEIPKYVWGTLEIPLSFDAYDIVKDACEELWEGAYDSIDRNDIDELQKILDDWCAKQTGAKTYTSTYTYCVLI